MTERLQQRLRHPSLPAGDFLGGSVVKHLPANAGDIWPLGQEDMLEEEMATQSNILAWKIPCIEEPGGLQCMGLQRVIHYWGTECMHAHAHTHTHTHTFWYINRKTPLQMEISFININVSFKRVVSTWVFRASPLSAVFWKITKAKYTCDRDIFWGGKFSSPSQFWGLENNKEKYNCKILAHEIKPCKILIKTQLTCFVKELQLKCMNLKII